MPTKKAIPRFSFSLSEFDEDDIGFRELREAYGFLDLPRVRQAVKELVEAHRENKTIVAAFPAKVQTAYARLRETGPRHSELASALKPHGQPGSDLVALNREILRLINIIGPREFFTVRLLEAHEKLCGVLFLTSKEKWKQQTGRERPRNLSELKTAMAKAGYKPDTVHADGLTPRFAEDYLLGFQWDKEQVTKAYLHENRITVGDRAIVLGKQEQAVVRALAELGAADTPALAKKSGYKYPATVLTRVIKKHRVLEGLITMPGARSRGGYSTTIKLVVE